MRLLVDHTVRYDRSPYSSTDTRHPLQTLVYLPGESTSFLTQIPAWLAAYMTRVLLNLISVNYTNADILLT